MQARRRQRGPSVPGCVVRGRAAGAAAGVPRGRQRLPHVQTGLGTGGPTGQSKLGDIRTVRFLAGEDFCLLGKLWPNTHPILNVTRVKKIQLKPNFRQNFGIYSSFCF